MTVHERRSKKNTIGPSTIIYISVVSVILRTFFFKKKNVQVFPPSLVLLHSRIRQPRTIMQGGEGRQWQLAHFLETEELLEIISSRDSGRRAF